MRFKKHVSSVFLFASFLLLGFGLPDNLEKKVQKEVEKAFGIINFSMVPLRVSPELNSQLPAKITKDNFYRLSDGTMLLGYAFVDRAPSKTAQFDYLVLFDTELKVIHTNVLIYREEYGGEIGSKRWLKQFTGKTGKDRVSIEDNIDAISGATISVRSMTRSMDNLLQTIGILQENKVL